MNAIALLSWHLPQAACDVVSYVHASSQSDYKLLEGRDFGL